VRWRPSFFADRGLQYDENDTAYPVNYKIHRNLAGLGTPLIFVGDIRLDGFSEKALEMVLRQVDLL